MFSRFGGLLSRSWQYMALAALLLAGVKIRFDQIGNFHSGDMDVILSATYSLFTSPPYAYYHKYASQPWIYNHLMAFPLMLAPFYWFFENVLSAPTAYAMKLLVGAADFVIALLLYRQARGPFPRLWGLTLAGAWLLAPWVTGSNDHPVSVAVALALLSLSTLNTAWLAGLLLGLGIATRSEVAFIALPIIFHLLAKRGWGDTARFLGSLSAIVTLIALPFVLYDPAAMDYALRRQLQRDTSDLVSVVSSTLLPWLSLEQSIFLQENPSLLALTLNFVTATLAFRDRRLSRVVLACALAYLLTLPLTHGRYLLLAYGAGLLHAALYWNVLLASVMVVTVWIGPVSGMYPLIAIYLAFVGSSVGWPNSTGVSRGIQNWRKRVFSSPDSVKVTARAAAILAVVASGYLVRTGAVEVPISPWGFQNSYTLDLLREVREGRVAVLVPPGVSPKDYVHLEKFTIGGSMREVLYMHPVSSVSVRFTPPERAQLQFAVGIRPDAWDEPGDGVDFQVQIRAQGKPETQVSVYLDPKRNEADRRWAFHSIDLGSFANQEVEVVLKTIPGSSPDADWAGWAFPRVAVR